MFIRRLGFSLRVALLGVCALTLPACYPQVPPTRDAILQDVRQTAKRHVDAGAGKDSKYVVDVWDQNTAGVTRQEILRTYDEAYTKAKQEHDKKDWIPKAGWVVAALVLLGSILVKRLGEAVGKLFDSIGEWMFNLFTALPWFYRLALDRYCKRMIAVHSDLKITFRPGHPLDLSTVFVPLKMSETQDLSEITDAYAALTRYSKLVVKGAPGSGKSILLRHIALTFSRRYQVAGKKERLPILVELSRLSEPEVTLRGELDRELSTKGFPKPEKFVSQELEAGRLLLLLDGLDEINSERRPSVVRQIRDLVDQFPATTFIASCRTQVYSGELDGIVNRTLEIQSFTDQQVRTFLRSWSADMKSHGKSVDQLMTTLLERPAIMLLAKNPLMLTIIAWLYTDTDVILPHSRSEFYRKATELLLYDWKQESNKFLLVPKQLILRELALHFLDTAHLRNQDRRTFEVREVLTIIERVLPSLNLDAKESAMPLLSEIVQRSGLLLSIDGGERYQFAHLTLQEYFAAGALRTNPDGLLERFQRDTDAWREPVKLWCGLDEDATTLIQAVQQLDPTTAFECLADAQKVEGAVANGIIESMKGLLLSGTADTSLIRAFGSVASSLSSRGKAVFNWLSVQDAPQALEGLSYTNMPQAAKTLAALYDTNPAVHPLLRRFGELAVGELSALASSGHSSAIDDLLLIGTPGAAEALVPLLWHTDPEIATRAAFALAGLFRTPEVLALLETIRMNKPHEAAWVWQPFHADEHTAIPVIAGRLALLLEGAYRLKNVPDVKLDPRLVLPACAQMGSDLTVIGSREEFRHRPLGALYRSVVGQAVESEELAERTEPSLEVLEDMTLALLERLKPSPRWRFLYERLVLPVRAELIRGISSTRPPGREDWTNIFHPVSYIAKRGWHLWVAFAVVQLVAIFDAVIFLRYRRPFTATSVVVPLALISGLLVHAIFTAMDDDPTDDLRYLIIGGVAIFAKGVWRELFVKRSTIAATISHLAFAWWFCLSILTCFPVWLYASFVALHRSLGTAFAIASICAVSTLVVCLWFRARTLHARARNPLSGLGPLLRPDREPPPAQGTFA